MVDDPTWGRLLDYPEHLETWQYEMNERVLRKTKAHLTNSRKVLAFCWSGGEDGFHVHMDVDGGNDEQEIEDRKEMRSGKKKSYIICELDSTPLILVEDNRIANLPSTTEAFAISTRTRGSLRRIRWNGAIRHEVPGSGHKLHVSW